MMQKTLLLLMLLLAVISLGACRKGVPPVTAVGSAVSVDQGKKFTEGDMRNAILKGCIEKNWSPVERSPGLIEATLVVRSKHTVVVEIPYTNQGYKINYKSSINMEYTENSDGTFRIHPNYNKWVDYLSQAIRSNIMLSQK